MWHDDMTRLSLYIMSFLMDCLITWARDSENYVSKSMISDFTWNSYNSADTMVRWNHVFVWMVAGNWFYLKVVPDKKGRTKIFYTKSYFLKAPVRIEILVKFHRPAHHEKWFIAQTRWDQTPVCFLWFICLCIPLFVCLCGVCECLFVYVSVCMSVCLSVRLYVCMYLCLFACMFVCLCVCLFVCLSVALKT